MTEFSRPVEVFAVLEWWMDGPDLIVRGGDGRLVRYAGAKCHGTRIAPAGPERLTMGGPTEFPPPEHSPSGSTP